MKLLNQAVLLPPFLTLRQEVRHKPYKRIALLLMLAGLSVSTPSRAVAQTSDAGTVTGSLTISGKTEPLRYIYGLSQKDRDNPKNDEIRIVLTNLPLPKEEADRLMSAALPFRQDNKTSRWGILLELRPPQKRMTQLVIFSPMGGTQLSGALESGPHKLALTSFTATRVAGKLTMSEPASFAFLPEGQTRETVYRFEATFTVPIRRAAPPQTLTGAAAQNSGSAEAVASFIEAAQKGDTAAMSGFFSASVATRLETPTGKALLTGYRQSAAILKRAQLQRVLLNGDIATLDFKPAKADSAGGGPAVLSLEMVQENGKWKLNP